MTEEELERIAEIRMDKLDARLMAGIYTQTQYDEAVKRLTDWYAAAYQAGRDKAWGRGVA